MATSKKTTTKKTTTKKKTTKVELTREFKEGDKVLYTNYGRFVPDKSGSHTLVIGDGDKSVKVTARAA